LDFANNYINREINKHMSTLVVVGYDDPYKAEEVRFKLRKLHSEYLLDLEDAVVAVNDEKGKVKLHQSVNLTADGAVSYGFLGSLTGLIFLNAWAAAAASGALNRCEGQRALHEGVGRHADSRQLNPFRPGEKTRAGKGAGRAEGNRRDDLEDLALARGRSQTAGRLERGKIVESSWRRDNEHSENRQDERRLLADSPAKAIFAASSSAGEVRVASRSPSMSSKILVVPQW
jgi:hypothetical protein